MVAPVCVEGCFRIVFDFAGSAGVVSGPTLVVGTYNSCKGSVDTPPTGVNKMLQTQSRMMKKWSSGVDTGSSSVDTRFSSQKAFLPIMYSVSTQPEVVSTLETLPREPFVPDWDSVSTHPMGRSTHSGNFFTLSHIWTRGTLGIMGIGLGSCAHDPQGYFWTHWAINTLQLAIQPTREPPRAFQKSAKSTPPPSSVDAV
ncbi:hypothetical protein Taro_036013 [Colocasia esculenta]|uniref:Uncharacterized protein n=1 Tax=Colocasia esculenta TaxID=4460 RepID=A0A843W0G8_COLES|nr:hypothetical protein [Colocasia esculenta]